MPSLLLQCANHLKKTSHLPRICHKGVKSLTHRVYDRWGFCSKQFKAEHI